MYLVLHVFSYSYINDIASVHCKTVHESASSQLNIGRMQHNVIGRMSRRMKVTICSERYVKTAQDLGAQFMKFLHLKFTHSYFVAIQVEYIPNDYHQSAMQQYNIGGTRDGLIFAPGCHDPVSIWDVTIDDTPFLVIGPRAFKKSHQSTHQVLVEEMVRNEQLHMYTTEIAELENMIRNQTLLTDTQEIEPDALEMLERTQPGPFGHGQPGQHQGLFHTTHQRPIQTKEERDLDWQMGFNRVAGLNHTIPPELDVPIEWQVCSEK
jgi:hypothetical protein